MPFFIVEDLLPVSLVREGDFTPLTALLPDTGKPGAAIPHPRPPPYPLSTRTFSSSPVSGYRRHCPFAIISFFASSAN